MSTPTKEKFNSFLSELKETNVTLGFYSDFAKIANNVKEIAINLNTLNYLLGKENIKEAVQDLWNHDPKVFDVMDILIATREKDRKKYIDAKGEIHFVHNLFNSVEGVMTFLQETGLYTVFQSKEIKNLVDYVFGIETGLDSNARKNRSGELTEKIVAKIFRSKEIKYDYQVSSKKFPAISNVLGADQKIFDFCIKTSQKTYLIEVNFYSTGGSKLNEVARSYTDIGPKINSIEGFEFVWITDGIGWHSAKNKLEEAFMIIPQIYNLTTIDHFIKKIKEEEI